jgi:hypothetical protein
LCSFYVDLSKVMNLKLLVHLVWTPPPPHFLVKEGCYS